MLPATLGAIFATLAAATPGLAAADGAVASLPPTPSYILIGFAGGFVRGGRPGPTPPKVLEEVRQRFAAIGGSSPLRVWTAAQAAALEKLLGIPVFFAMRNWYPT